MAHTRLRLRRSLVERQLQTETFSEEEKQSIIEQLEQREREYTRFQRQRMSAADFEPLTVIGRGAFGEASHHALCSLRAFPSHRISVLSQLRYAAGPIM